MMVRMFWEEERREVQGIYEDAIELEIVGIVMDDIMSTNEVHLSFFQKLLQFRLGRLVKGSSIISQGSDVVYLMSFSPTSVSTKAI